MKRAAIVLSVTILLVTGCEYDDPLTTKHNIPIDSAVLGWWELRPDEGQEPDPDEQMMILKYSDTEYVIHYPVGKNGIYWRGYPVRVGDVACVQLQVIGTGDGPVFQNAGDRFHVVAYRLIDGDLEVKTLNTDLVDDDLKGSQALQQAFLEHKNHTALFIDPGRFRPLGG